MSLTHGRYQDVSKLVRIKQTCTYTLNIDIRKDGGARKRPWEEPH